MKGQKTTSRKHLNVQKVVGFQLSRFRAHMGAVNAAQLWDQLIFHAAILSGREAASQSRQSVRKEKAPERLSETAAQDGTVGGSETYKKRADNVEWTAGGQHRLRPRTVRGNTRAEGAVILNLTAPPAPLRLQPLALALSLAGRLANPASFLG